jgi:hypothetical protein
MLLREMLQAAGGADEAGDCPRVRSDECLVGVQLDADADRSGLLFPFSKVSSHVR